MSEAGVKTIKTPEVITLLLSDEGIECTEVQVVRWLEGTEEPPGTITLAINRITSNLPASIAKACALKNCDPLIQQGHLRKIAGLPKEQRRRRARVMMDEDGPCVHTTLKVGLPEHLQNILHAMARMMKLSKSQLISMWVAAALEEAFDAVGNLDKGDLKPKSKYRNLTQHQKLRRTISRLTNPSE